VQQHDHLVSETQATQPSNVRQVVGWLMVGELQEFVS